MSLNQRLEVQAGVNLFLRRTKLMHLTAVGLGLLRLAEKILPEIDAVQADFSGLRNGRAGRMQIAIECHACFEWLFPVLEAFRKLCPMSMWIFAPGWPLTRCRRCKRKMWMSRFPRIRNC